MDDPTQPPKTDRQRELVLPFFRRMKGGVKSAYKRLLARSSFLSAQLVQTALFVCGALVLLVSLLCPTGGNRAGKNLKRTPSRPSSALNGAESTGRQALPVPLGVKEI